MTSSDPDMSVYSEAQPEGFVISGIPDFGLRGAAKAELTKRQRRHEIMIAEAEDKREIHRKAFDERLAKENREHAEKIAAQELEVVQRGVVVTGLAAFAALMSAVAAIATLWLSFHNQDLRGRPFSIDVPAKSNSVSH